MRKHQQKLILELLTALNTATSEIKHLLSRGERPGAIRLMTDCQADALKIGTFIEHIAGEGTTTVSLLEKYCDLLYQLYQATNNTGNIVKNLQNHLAKIENSARTELKPNKIEIAFLPYKASMFDTFESIWLAARDDPECDTYVVPIPYFTRNSDGVFDHMHYEGNQYPDYVPITNWQNYNIEERRPDIIFIHNPYDQNNHVTSVYLDYYSKRLKKFTDLLVYVPYFVCVSDIISQDFCVCAGTMYADRVIVQSEQLRETYIRFFNKFENEYNCRGVFGDAAKKFVALGSPKFDKVINTKREDCKIPAEWCKLIEKSTSDGKRKKIILYNTAVGEILNGNEQALRKLRYVLDCFKKRDDIILLWRPHPLSEATCQSMRPRLLKEYISITDEYRQAGFGIYDDTADLHRAIAISDAYYGDMSSLVALYQYTGQPILLQGYEFFENGNLGRMLKSYSLCDTKDYFYFISQGINALFRMDKTTKEVKFLGSFPDTMANIHGFLYNAAALCGEKLYFAPCTSNEIGVFDLNTEQFEKIPFRNPLQHKKTASDLYAKFAAVSTCKKWVYFVGSYYPAILRYDTVTGEINYFDDWLEPLTKLLHKENFPYLSSCSVAGSVLLAASANANAVVEFDMESCVSTVHEVGSKENFYSGICFDGNSYWLAPYHGGAVVKWDPRTLAWTEYDGYPPDILLKQFSFAHIGYAAGYVWLLPANANMALKINVSSGVMEQADEFLKEDDYARIHFEYVTPDGRKIYTHSLKKICFTEHDSIISLSNEHHSSVSNEDNLLKTLDKLRNKALFPTAKQGFFYEHGFCTLRDFLDNLGGSNQSTASSRQAELQKCQIAKGNVTAGKAIYEYCKNEVWL